MSATFPEIVKKYFEIIYNSTNLACSFDTYRLGYSPFLNWHIDQNQSHEDYLNCVQGVIILKDSNVTKLLNKSHLYFKELSERISDKDNNTWEFYEVPDNDKIWKYNLKMGLTIFWDKSFYLKSMYVPFSSFFHRFPLKGSPNIPSSFPAVGLGKSIFSDMCSNINTHTP